MKRIVAVSVLVLSLLCAPACSSGGCTCPGDGKNPVCQGC